MQINSLLKQISMNQQFPYLQQMDAIIDIEKAIAGQNNLIANAIRLSIKEEPATVTITMIKCMATDNLAKMQDILGVSLINKIFSI